MSTSDAGRAEAITIVTFRLKPQQSVEQFLKLSGDLVAWLHGRDGFCRYELFRKGEVLPDGRTNQREAELVAAQRPAAAPAPGPEKAPGPAAAVNQKPKEAPPAAPAAVVS